MSKAKAKVTQRYQIDWDAEVVEDTETGDAVSIQETCNLLNRGLRTAKACEAVLARLDYLQELWGKEGITDGLAKAVRDALKED